MADPLLEVFSSQPAYVLDASVAVKWYVPEVHSTEALRFLAGDCHFHVPAFFYTELANTIWKKVGQRH